MAGRDARDARPTLPGRDRAVTVTVTVTGREDTQNDESLLAEALVKQKRNAQTASLGMP